MAPILKEGFWGKTTSTIDWCETNYEVSFFFAEFWNTISNLALIIPPLIEWIRLSGQRIPSPYLLCFALLIFTGVGSFLFHMTLKYEMQIWDETAMVLEGLLILYLLLQTLFPTFTLKPIVKYGLVLYGLSLIAVYLTIKNPIFFQLGFAIIHFSTQCVGWITCKSRLSSSKIFWSAFFLNYTAFVFWILDNNLCNYLQCFKSYLPFILHLFVHFHAIWHILAGYGTFIFVTFLIHAHLKAQNFKIKGKISWNGLGLVYD